MGDKKEINEAMTRRCGMCGQSFLTMSLTGKYVCDRCYPRIEAYQKSRPKKMLRGISRITKK